MNDDLWMIIEYLWFTIYNLWSFAEKLLSSLFATVLNYHKIEYILLLPGTSKYVVLPLHSQIPREDQRKVFQPVPPGVRKVILLHRLNLYGCSPPCALRISFAGHLTEDFSFTDNFVDQHCWNKYHNWWCCLRYWLCQVCMQLTNIYCSYSVAVAASALLPLQLDAFIYTCSPYHRAKIKMFTSHNNMTNYATVWASKTNMEQRKGRAGRVRQGFCFHLCSRARAEKWVKTFQRCIP